MSGTELIQNVIDAIALGSVYALFALGVALIFGVMRLVNLAHGEIIMAVGYSLAISGGLPWWIRIACALLVGMLLAAAMHQFAFKPLRGADDTTLLIASFAVSMLLQNVALTWQGSDPEGVANLPVINSAIEIGALRVSTLSIASAIVTVVLLVGIQLILKRTDLGLRMRASAEDFTMARLLGVGANKVILTAFVGGGFLAAIGGILVVSQTGSVTPDIGFGVMLFGLVACIVGGLGTLSGAVLGGYLIGAAAVALQVVLPLGLRPYRDAFLFAIVFLVILWRPGGIISSKALEERV